MIKHLIFVCCLLLLSGAACAQSPQTAAYYGVAVRIIDGDTFDLLADDHRKVRVRLHGVDCPERGMDFYKVAKEALGSLCAGQRLQVVRRDRDRYGRLVADVYTGGSTWVNEAMIRRGLAWHYIRYDNDRRLTAAEQAAKRAGLGIWSLPHPVAPWEWRREKRKPSQSR